MRHEGTLRAHFVTDAGVRPDMHVLGMLPEDLAGAPAFRSGREAVRTRVRGA